MALLDCYLQQYSPLEPTSPLEEPGADVDPGSDPGAHVATEDGTSDPEGAAEAVEEFGGDVGTPSDPSYPRN